MIFETPIVFPGGDSMLSGVILRDSSGADARRIGVIVTGSWLTVKEQMALLYARRLSSLGYVTLVFDFAGFGESKGEPRQAEIPTRKVKDICAAAEFMSTLSFIDHQRIGLVSICASAQYAQHSIARGAKIAAFASVAGWYHDAETIAPFYGNHEGVERRMEFARQDVSEYLRGEPRTFAPAYAPGDERAAMYFKLDYYSDAARGAIAEWSNKMAPMSWAHWLSFDGLSVASLNRIPSLMVHGPACALPTNAKRVYEQWAGPKQLEWADGSQIDFYDQPTQVGRAVTTIDAWFGTHLAPLPRETKPA